MIVRDAWSLQQRTKVKRRFATKVFKVEAGKGYTRRELGVTWGFSKDDAEELRVTVFEMWEYKDSEGNLRTGVSSRYTVPVNSRDWTKAENRYNVWVDLLKMANRGVKKI